MVWRPAVLLVAAVMSSACGEAEVGADDQVVTSETHSGDAADGDLDDAVEELSDELDVGDGGARVVLGDRTFEFTLAGTSPEVDGTVYLGTCRTLFDAIMASGYEIQDGGVATMELELPPADWESYEDGRFDTTTPRIKIEDVATEQIWVADPTHADLHPEMEGASQIDAWVTDGTAASGTATFTELTPWSAPVEDAEPLQGSFELGCSDD